MKELEENKINMFLTSLYKTLIYVCWFLFGISFYCLIGDGFSNFDIFLLIIFLVSFYTLRNVFKYLYKNIAGTSYLNIKKGIELHYFKKCISLDYEDIDKNELDKKILNLSYRYTKMIKDIGECIIPCFIGVLILFIVLVKTSVILSLIVLIAIGVLLYFEFINNKEELKNKNTNSLLEDFIHNLFTIKVLNLGDYCIDRLNNDTNIVLPNLRTNDVEDNVKFNVSLLGILLFILLFIFIFVSSTVGKLTLIISILLVCYKLQLLLNGLVSSIKNIINCNKDKVELELLFNNNVNSEYVSEFNTVNVINGLIKYESGVQIKIPNFELKNGDTVSIMGKSGQGKSTIVNVLSGINKLNEGKILFDENELNGSLDGVYIGNNINLFKVSLRDNLKLYKEIEDEEILSLLKEVGLINWYNELPNGLDTIIDFMVSGDVLLRLSLVRGIILNKNVYFFDFDALGTEIESEKIITNFIKKNLKKKTYIIVTHSPLITNICKKHYFIKDHTLLESEPLL